MGAGGRGSSPPPRPRPIGDAFQALKRLGAAGVMMTGVGNVLSACHLAHHPDAKNVLLIVADDMRYDHLPFMPNVQALIADQGRTFTQARCNVALCQPSRVGLVTGQMSKHNGEIGIGLVGTSISDHNNTAPPCTPTITKGTAQIVVDETRGVIVGATFVEAEVGEMLHSATIAVVGEVPLDPLWHAVPAFPSVSDVWLRLLEAYGLLMASAGRGPPAHSHGLVEPAPIPTGMAKRGALWADCHPASGAHEAAGSRV